MAGKLTTHALDTQQGCAAAGLKVEVRRSTPTAEDLGWSPLIPAAAVC